MGKSKKNRKKLKKIRHRKKPRKIVPKTNRQSNAVNSYSRGRRYSINNSFEFLYELRDLVLKSSPTEKDTMIQKINRLGRIKLAVVAGIFMNKESPDPTVVDLLIVGDDIENKRLRAFLKSLEAEIGKEIKFSVMEKDEFQYRFSMFDRFIRVLFESPHEKLINKLGL